MSDRNSACGLLNFPHGDAGIFRRLAPVSRDRQPPGVTITSWPLSKLVLCVAFAAAMLAPNARAQDGTIVVLGDSNAAGFGVAPQDAFPARLESMLRKRGRRARVVNAGVSGDTFGALASRVDRSVPTTASLVIVQAGFNDRAFGVPPEQTIANMRAVLSKVRARRANAVLCGFFDRKWDAIGRKVAASYGAKFVPGSTCYDPQHRGPDGLHMSAGGHEVVASRLALVLQSPQPKSAKRANDQAGQLKGPRKRPSR